MIWAGSPFAHLIKFETGAPTGAIAYSLLANNGTTVLDSGNITPPAGSVSRLLTVSGAYNTVATDLFESRTLTYSYTTASGLVSNRIAYRVAKPIPFAVSVDGVRKKLGIEKHELADDSVDLVLAYAELSNELTLTPYEAAGNRGNLLCIHAIEALAALQAMPTLQLAIAQSETSGTNEYKRFGLINWDKLRADLLLHISRLRELIEPTTDGLGDYSVFTTAGRATDEITGASR